MTPDCFFLHEDDWGMIDLQPRENLAAAQTTVSEAREHGETHRAPDGLGYTAVYWYPEGIQGWQKAGQRMAEAQEIPMPGYQP